MNLKFRIFNYFYEEGGRWMLLAILPKWHPHRYWIRLCGHIAKLFLPRRK